MPLKFIHCAFIPKASIELFYTDHCRGKGNRGKCKKLIHDTRKNKKCKRSKYEPSIPLGMLNEGLTVDGTLEGWILKHSFSFNFPVFIIISLASRTTIK